MTKQQNKFIRVNAADQTPASPASQAGQQVAQPEQNAQRAADDNVEATQQMPAVSGQASSAFSPTQGQQGAASPGNGQPRHGAHIASELGPAPVKSSSSSDEVLVRKKRRHHKKRRRALIIVAVILVVLIAVGIAAAIAYNNAIKAGQEAMLQAADAEVSTAESAVSYDEGRTVTHNGHTYKLNENMVSVVVMGYDRTESTAAAGQNGQADAVMVLAFDTKTGKATAIGVPRDSMVDVSRTLGSTYIGTDTMQLCLAFAYGDGADTSAENVTSAVSRTLYNMPMTYYLALNLEGVGPINDSIGGVTITPLQSIPGTDIVEGEETILRGSNALSYVKWRDTSILTSPLDRQARQVQYVKAFASKALTQAKGNVTSMIGLFNTASEYSITNLGLNEFSYLASTVVGSGVTSLDVVTLQGEAKQGETFMEYYLDKESVYQTVLDVYYTQVS